MSLLCGEHWEKIDTIPGEFWEITQAAHRVLKHKKRDAYLLKLWDVTNKNPWVWVVWIPGCPTKIEVRAKSYIELGENAHQVVEKHYASTRSRSD